MKTTVELPDDLVIEAKNKAAEKRTTLRRLFEQALRRELAELQLASRKRESRKAIRWVAADVGLPPGMDVADRAAMHEWLRRKQ